MPQDTKTIERSDIMDLDAYEKVRAEKRSALVANKKNRRVEVGPYATFYFENYETMWMQIHEMLRIERGGEDQIKDELAAYNPLIPQGSELVATMMLEIEDEIRRAKTLAKLGGIEETVTLKFGDHIVKAVAEEDVDRTTAGGKTSSVHFLHFPMTPEQCTAFKSGDDAAILAIDREGYQHMAVLPQAVRAALAGDLDG